MKTGSMIYSLLNVPRFRIQTLANCWGETFHSFSTTCGNNSSIMLLSSRINGLQGGQRKKWTRPKTTNIQGKGSNKSKNQSQQIQYCDIQKIVENKDLSCYTVIVFHNETTRFSRENDRIIEIALGDVQGGKNTTFQTLLSHQQSQLAPFSLTLRIQM
ncbi:Exonuclease DPD1, chloroplastic/mitochondrial [Glycine soja]|uniref:Exonuclease DPD1, chloroplastic/mitochondrial n=1 Tax=Glycine soja TaxID=3848 RepID=A0A445FET4_GLYSO|nr:Exonuclease DPD1, chloroplastic/mitochondrial [Glycine soja]